MLDFFAGSGTTGQVVMELNAEDGGRRRFILCSSTEANDKEPARTCAAIVRNASAVSCEGYGGKDAHRLIAAASSPTCNSTNLTQLMWHWMPQRPCEHSADHAPRSGGAL